MTKKVTKAKEVVVEVCTDCNNTGLKDMHTLCPACNGRGK